MASYYDVQTMIYSILTLILAAFGLGVLIFIHELGHYMMARKVGMRVEAFSIGFGKALVTWQFQGVKWQLCALPFGGYVRITGMEKKGTLEPHEIQDGFFGKKPWQRIQVALMGPIINILFALLAFSIIWAFGGRQRPFSEYTHTIGWIDPHSPLWAEGVRPGDEITSLNGKPFEGFRGIAYAVILGEKMLAFNGLKINHQTGQKEPFVSKLDLSQHDRFSLPTPASFLLYDYLLDGASLEKSGLQRGDRLVWVDGQLLFSSQQLTELINEPKALITVEREGKRFLARVPRLTVRDLKTNPAMRAELSDWQHAAGLKTRLANLFFVPYNLSYNCQVEEPLVYIDENSKERNTAQTGQIGPGPLDIALEKGDRILAVDGIPVQNSSQLLLQLQTRHIQMIVQREMPFPALSWKDADGYLQDSVKSAELEQIVSTIGQAAPLSQVGNLHLLKPATPKPLQDYSLTPKERAWLTNKEKAEKKEIESIDDQRVKQEALAELESNQKRVKLGIMFRDAPVNYNPSPFVLFSEVCVETWQTLVALVTGLLSPKLMTGPVGIVQVMQYGWSLGVKEALFWMAVVSLNLGLLNLLPLPVLDGGHICFSIYEAVTKRRISAKVMERLIVPFIILLVAFFIYVTYQDILRLIARFF
jgi:regulator of sigma E protease